MSEISETSFWLKFFTEAGIPPSDATGYAITFSDNRIKQDMLPDLNKEYLKDMGITALGDIIAILKHAKNVTSKLSRERAFPVSSTQTNTYTAVTSNSTASETPPATSHGKKNSAATRILEHYVRRDQPQTSSPSPSSLVISPSLSARLSCGTKRQLEDEETVKPSKRSSTVFDRLGGENDVSSTTTDPPKIMVTIRGKKQRSESPVRTTQAQLPSPRERAQLPSPRERAQLPSPRERAQFTSPRERGSLQYHGVLKYSKKELQDRQHLLETKLKKSPHLSITVKSAQADSTADIRSRLGKASRPNTQSEGIFARELDDLVDKRKTPMRSDQMNPIKKLRVGQQREERLVLKKVVKMKKSTGQIVSQKKLSSGTIFSRIS